MRGGTATARIIAMGAAASLAACAPALPPPPDAPPVIELADVPVEVRIGQVITYVLSDGGTVEVEPEGYRVLGPAGWSGHLVILGWDTDGQFVASFMRQHGLPDSCFIENDVGIDRGAFIETRGVLWSKSDAFVPAEAVAPDTAYPPGTRFCFDRTGVVTSTVSP
jgi:hypothetical protein